MDIYLRSDQTDLLWSLSIIVHLFDHLPPLPSAEKALPSGARAPSAKFWRSSSDMSIGTPYSWPTTLCSTWVHNVHSGRVGLSYFEVCQTMSNYLGAFSYTPSWVAVFSSSLAPCCKGWDYTMSRSTMHCIRGRNQHGLAPQSLYPTHHQHHTSSTNKSSDGKHGALKHRCG